MPNDLIIFMGAGNITHWAYEKVENFASSMVKG